MVSRYRAIFYINLYIFLYKSTFTYLLTYVHLHTYTRLRHSMYIVWDYIYYDTGLGLSIPLIQTITLYNSNPSG